MSRENANQHADRISEGPKARKRKRLDDAFVSAVPVPERGNKIYYDMPNRKGNGYVSGFGLRVTAGGHRSFILNYRTKSGRERRYTIGAPPVWNVAAARAEAIELKSKINLGGDPLAVARAGREAPTVADLCDRFKEEYLPKKRPSTQRDYKALIDREIEPALGSTKVADVTFSDIDRLHRKISKRGATYFANRTVALLSRLFSLAIKWQYRTDNPAKGIERNPEERRERYLSAEEIARLVAALATHDDQVAANIIRLLLLTGARRGEVQAAKWAQFDLAEGVWTKPAATTKQAKLHRVPLNGPARQLLNQLRKKADDDAEYLFPGRFGGFRTELKKDWAAICKAANLKDARMHDLRHTFASHLASSGQTLPIIGALLGHTQPATTARYAHLLDDPLKRATERVGKIISGANIVPLSKTRA
jgi:integrase